MPLVTPRFATEVRIAALTRPFEKFVDSNRTFLVDVQYKKATYCGSSILGLANLALKPSRLASWSLILDHGLIAMIILPSERIGRLHEQHEMLHSVYTQAPELKY